MREQRDGRVYDERPGKAGDGYELMVARVVVETPWCFGDARS
jgi:hypothetical protein